MLRRIRGIINFDAATIWENEYQSSVSHDLVTGSEVDNIDSCNVLPYRALSVVVASLLGTPYSARYLQLCVLDVSRGVVRVCCGAPRSKAWERRTLLR